MDRKVRLLFCLVLIRLLAQQTFAHSFNLVEQDTSRLNKPFEADSRQQFHEQSRSQNAFLNRSRLGAPVNTRSPVDVNALSVYGFDLFNQEATNLLKQEVGAFVMPPNYRLGPGDKISIFLLGNVQENREVMVNVEGKVFIPPAGVLYVWGLTMDELKSQLTGKFSKYYDNFSVDLMLLAPKNVQVSVVGDVVRPGKYILSAMNTVLDAVIFAGGPTKRGSLRDIQLLRNGKKVASVDLYEFLMSGRKEFDVYLEAGDRIRVPLAEKKVLVKGEVERPSIFELKPDANERLTDVVELAEGFTDYAYLDKIEISRLLENGHRRLLYVDYNQIVQGDSSQNITMKNEDQVRVFSKLEQIHEGRVAIYGEIRRPGSYVLQDNLHLSDLILKAGNLTRKAYTLEAEVAKVDPGKPTQFIKVNLEQMNDGHDGHDSNDDILLDEDDQVFIRQIPEWEVDLTVEVQGEVKFPGKYSIVKDSTGLNEILTKAGGFTEDAFLQEAYVWRSSSRLKFDKEFERLKRMRRDEMTDLEYQYLVMRQNSSDVKRIVVNFEKLYYGHDATEDIILEDGDVIVVPKAPKVVSVTGSVAKPGGVTFQADAGLSYYIAKAGGATWDASLKRTKVIKVTGEVLDDEDVHLFQPGDIIWVPRKSDKKFWPIALQSITVAAQLASIFLIIDTALRR